MTWGYMVLIDDLPYLYITDDLQALSTDSDFNCSDGSRNLTWSNMRYHSFAIPENYSAVVNIQPNVTSEDIQVFINANINQVN